MNAPLENLRELAARAKRGDPLASRELQHQLQSGLAHVLRRTLRVGGESAVARWLGRTLGVESDAWTGSDPHELASLLCKELTCPRQSGSPRATVSAREMAETVIA